MFVQFQTLPIEAGVKTIAGEGTEELNCPVSFSSRLSFSEACTWTFRTVALDLKATAGFAAAA